MNLTSLTFVLGAAQFGLVAGAAAALAAPRGRRLKTGAIGAAVGAFAGGTAAVIQGRTQGFIVSPSDQSLPAGASQTEQPDVMAFGEPQTPGLPICARARFRYRGVFRFPESPADNDPTMWPLLAEWIGASQSLQDRAHLEASLRQWWTGAYPLGVWALGNECGSDAFVMYRVASGWAGSTA